MSTEYQPITPRYRIGEWLTQAWALFTARLWELVALTLVMVLPSLVLIAAVIPLQILYLNRMPQSPHPFLYPSWTQVISSVVSIVLAAAIVTPVYVGASAVFLNYVRTRNMDWQRLGLGFRRWSACFLLGLFPGAIGALTGLFMPLMLLVPLWAVLYLWVMFCYFGLTEDGATYSGALRHGWELIRGNFWQAVLAYLLVIALCIAGFAACCVGVVFAGALAQVYQAIAYNDLSRQLTAALPRPSGEGWGEGPASSA